MRMCSRVLLFCLTAASVASTAGAADVVNAWNRAGAPIAASAFVSPRGAEAGGISQANALATSGIDGEFDRGGVLNEIRLGVLGFWQQNSSSEEGIYISGQVLFDPFVWPFENRILDALLRPRPHIGATASPWGTDQVFAGLTWTAPFGRIVFAEASLGGTVHDGPLSDAQVALGCRVLFRESLGLGVNVGRHWRVVASVDHSSHSGLCGNDNDGLTHIGGFVGYRF
jgi:hypothetical protein